MTSDNRDTMPRIATADTDRPPPIIPAGGAERAIAQAIRHAAGALADLEALAMAVARQLDAMALDGKP